MKEIEFLPGTEITEAAQLLVANAPAFGMFNGIRMRARHATTRAVDIVRQVNHERATRCVIWENNADGKRWKAEREAALREGQTDVDELLAQLPHVDFGNTSAVLTWVEDFERADIGGLRIDRDGLRSHFDAHGWARNAFVKPNFNGDDARVFAGWIVGQWLDSWRWMPNFVEQWRAKFESTQLVNT